MKRQKTNPTNFSIPLSVTEQEFFACICRDELLIMIMFFQQEKRRYMKVYLEYVEFIFEANNLEMLESLEWQKKKYWEKQQHFESLVQWCFIELNNRRSIQV